MVPIRFQVVGEEDYAFDVEIDSTGEYVVNSGTYTSQPPRTGTLTREQEEQLLAAIKALGIPDEHPVPQGVEAFEARLTVGDGAQAVTYPFFEGALEQDAGLKALVRLLEML
jgi:hypothetical protein